MATADDKSIKQCKTWTDRTRDNGLKGMSSICTPINILVQEMKIIFNFGHFKSKRNNSKKIEIFCYSYWHKYGGKYIWNSFQSQNCIRDKTANRGPRQDYNSPYKGK